VTWAVPILVVPLAIFTLAVLATDTARTADWTAARANLRALTGADDCGLAEDLRVPALDSVRPLAMAAGMGPTRNEPDWIGSAPIRGIPRFALGPTLDSATRTPWFTLGSSREVAWFVGGRLGAGDRLQLQWGAGESERDAVVIGEDDFTPAPNTAEAVSMPWRLVTQPEVDPPPARATMMRIALDNDSGTAGAVAVTAPFEYSYERLATTLADASAALVLPHVATYFSCLELAQLRNGVAESPELIVTTVPAEPLLLDPGTSPFNGVLDLYGIQRLPVVDSAMQPFDMAVYRVDQRIPGWRKVAAAQSSSR
jgi:hypothetical protein